MGVTLAMAFFVAQKISNKTKYGRRSKFFFNFHVLKISERNEMGILKSVWKIWFSPINIT
jgi:hypothetical protein